MCQHSVGLHWLELCWPSQQGRVTLPAWVSVGHKMAWQQWLLSGCLFVPFVPQRWRVMTLSNPSFCQGQSALLSHKLLSPADCNLTPDVSQIKSSSPSHSSPHFCSCEHPSILGVVGVLLASLPSCCAGNRPGSLSPHCDQALGTRPRLVSSAPHKAQGPC